MQTEAIFDNIAERIQIEISKAQNSIFIAVAWFTNKNLFDELLNKAKKGCKIHLIISNDFINRTSSIDYNQLHNYNSNVYKIGNGDTDLMHNKFCVIDFSTIITGSYNWSYKAEHNYENVIITNNDTSLAEQFIAEFNNIKKQYYPEDIVEEVVLPLGKIIKRLEIIKNYIVLEDIEALNNEILKLKEFDFNAEISEIISFIFKKAFSDAVLKIQFFISKNQQLNIWTDPEINALKFEIKNLENQLNAYDNEKIELEKLLADFQNRHLKELGQTILEILRLRKLKFKGNKEKYEEAENDEKQYEEHLKTEKDKEIFELTADEKIELKKKFRKATVLCHPDKVSEEFKDAAQKIFIELKEAYDRNNLKRVNEILEDLEKGNYFKTKSETVTYKTVAYINDWDDYFKTTKEQLQKELSELIIELKSS